MMYRLAIIICWCIPGKLHRWAVEEESRRKSFVKIVRAWAEYQASWQTVEDATNILMDDLGLDQDGKELCNRVNHAKT